MLNSDTINIRQNEDQYLIIQYAARKCFNGAEKINYLSWVFCLISALLFFVPDSTTKYITIGLPSLLDIIALISTLIFNKRVKNAADLRNYFDSQVLMINEDNYTANNKQKLRELSLNIYQKNQSEADISIHNTGRDDPPGVRNWYEFKNTANGVNAQFECQCQNIWWNKKMINNRRICLGIFSTILFVTFALLFILFRIETLNIFACSVGIVLKAIERFIEHKKYYDTSLKIEAIQEHINNNLTSEGVEKLQDLINERRCIPVLEINLIHRKKAKKYSTSYEKTS